MHWRESEKDGQFLLESETGCFASFSGDGDLGTGPHLEYLRFESKEGRHYYKALRDVQEQLAKSQSEVRSLRASIKDCVTKKGLPRRKRLLRLISDINAPAWRPNPVLEKLLKNLDG